MNKCCVYHARGNGHISLDGATEAYRAFYDEMTAFHDFGDDPSFYSAEKVKSNLTWGVCRHNIRQQLHLGDTVFFVARTIVGQGSWEYHFVGFGEVAAKIAHRHIFQIAEYHAYQNYFNLLGRPVENGRFQHYEPTPPNLWHEDWKMRLSRVNWEAHLQNFIFDEGDSWVGPMFPFGTNYIVFSPETTRVRLHEPLYLCATTFVNGTLDTDWRNGRHKGLFVGGAEGFAVLTGKGPRHVPREIHERDVDEIKGLLA